MISMQSLTKDYVTPAGAFTALRDVNLEVGAGEFAAIIGKSGSGKSTLLNMIGGIDSPSSGSVTVNGVSIRELNQRQLALWRGRTIGFVFQFFQLLPTLTITENVMLPMDFSKQLPVGRRRQRALDLLERVGVAEQADKLPATLSGGQQQRAAIARALANDPPVILADEPTGNLDSVTAAVVLDLFHQLAQQGAAVVIATHERDIPGVDRIIEMTDGLARTRNR